MTRTKKLSYLLAAAFGAAVASMLSGCESPRPVVPAALPPPRPQVEYFSPVSSTDLLYQGTPEIMLPLYHGTEPAGIVPLTRRTLSPVSGEATVPRVLTNYITVTWKARGSNGVVIPNAPTRVLWTDNLRQPWLIAVTNTTTNQIKFQTTNPAAWFKVERTTT